MDNIVILDCGSQYTQLIARRIREMKVHSEILPWDTELEEIQGKSPTGIVISGGPQSVRDEGSPTVPKELFELGIPVLGLCYGMQLMTNLLGGNVESGKRREYGRATITVTDQETPLFQGIPDSFQVWMSHGDHIDRLPDGFTLLAETLDGVPAAMKSDNGMLWALQFHPEVVHTQNGINILENFLFGISNCKGDWDLGDWVENMIEDIRKQVGTSSVICGLSGGVDSTVAAVLTHRAIGDRLECIFVNNGLLRADEAEHVLERYKELQLKV
nr:glutamine-hydrolyzing GMP synthase [Synergistales bacterium]